jgi:hypothetical protein
MQNGQQSTKNRKGVIDQSNVEYIVTVTVKNGHIIAAEGHITQPQNAHNKFLGASWSLIDNETGNTYGIFVTDSRFSFENYRNIDALFSN